MGVFFLLGLDRAGGLQAFGTAAEAERRARAEGAFSRRRQPTGQQEQEEEAQSGGQQAP